MNRTLIVVIVLFLIVIPMATDNYNTQEKRQQYTWSFDDGPSQHTHTILDILKEKNIKAVFYIVGKNISGHEDVITRMHNEGHEICLHTYTHSDITQMTDGQLLRELEQTAEAIERITGTKPRCFRPPFGKIDDRTRDLLSGYDIRWSLAEGVYDSMDWTQVASGKLITDFSTNYKSYREFLFHDRYTNTVEALPTLIDSTERR